MSEQHLQPAPQFEETGERAPRRPLPLLPHRPFGKRFASDAAREPATPEEIPEGGLREATYRRDAIYRRTLALADVASAAIAVLIGVPILGQDALNPAALLALPLVLVVGKITGLYDRDEHLIRKTTLDEVPTLFWVATLYALLIWLAGDLIVDGHFGRDQAVGVWALLFASMVTIRALARHLASALSSEERCLVLGDAETANWIRCRFDEAPGLKARVVGAGAARDGARLERLRGRQRRNGNGGNGVPGENGGSLERLLTAERIERAIIAPRGAISDDLLNSTRSLKSMGMRVSVLPRLPEVVGSSVELDDVDGITLLGMRRFGLSRSSGAVKRSFDFVGAGLALLALAPLLTVIAIAIKLDSRGPILFRQRRMGRNGVPFEMLKFRTMVDGAEAAEVRTRSAKRGGRRPLQDQGRSPNHPGRQSSAADLAR